MAIMPNDYSAVPMGKFLSIVTDFCTMITFLNGKQETVLRLSYTFINLQNLKTYEFEETYMPSLNNPRFIKFLEYLRAHFSEEEIDFETDIIGLVEEVDIDWDYLAGYAHPVIVERKFIYLPEPEAIPLVPLEED